MFFFVLNRRNSFTFFWLKSAIWLGFKRKNDTRMHENFGKREKHVKRYHIGMIYGLLYLFGIIYGCTGIYLFGIIYVVYYTNWYNIQNVHLTI